MDDREVDGWTLTHDVLCLLLPMSRSLLWGPCLSFLFLIHVALKA